MGRRRGTNSQARLGGNFLLRVPRANACSSSRTWSGGWGGPCARMWLELTVSSTFSRDLRCASEAPIRRCNWEDFVRQLDRRRQRHRTHEAQSNGHADQRTATMASLASGIRNVRCPGRLTRCGWQQGLAIRPKSSPKVDIRQLNTSELPEPRPSLQRDPVAAIKIPFENVVRARQVPESGSYFSREPRFNDMHLQLFKLLAKYHDLPMVKPSDAPRVPWLKLNIVRHQTGEPVKAAHFAKVMQVAKRLNLIEPSIRPAEVDVALQQLSQPIESTINQRRPIQVDKHGRAVGVGRRKVSTARAFVVEGTGEVLINGKPLSDAFGRIHDRESAIWALTSTERLDKYNVWAIVRGGGTTGQAEALTMAIANGLVAHEPALKTALRQGEWNLTLRISGGFWLIVIFLNSRLHHQRLEDGGEEEAWPRQGSQGPGLGQAIMWPVISPGIWLAVSIDHLAHAYVQVRVKSKPAEISLALRIACDSGCPQSGRAFFMPLGHCTCKQINHFV